jgi:predicted nucleotidyltransferase
MVNRKLDISSQDIAGFCRRWKITEFSLFGSILRGDFRAESDIDVMVDFAADAEWDLFDLVAMQDELEAMFGRAVDLVDKQGLRNPFRRHNILTSREVIYAA